LLTDQISNLKEAYREINKSLNVSSMCLYSGPIRHSFFCNHHLRFSLKNQVLFNAERFGWLGTGDADLACDERRKRFLKHYQHLLRDVATLTLPHHGSAENFKRELVDCIQPYFCVVAADQYRNWHHPATSVAQACGGRFLSVVTSKEESEVEENVYMQY